MVSLELRSVRNRISYAALVTDFYVVCLWAYR